jgi:LysR family transcriptional regulator, regulator for genes of the gallate degradation pathway
VPPPGSSAYRNPQIAECGSFEAAARRLNISQPALHRSARDLERVVRRSLYQRMARGMAPTSQARELARRLKVALRELEYGVEEFGQRKVFLRHE